MIRISSPTIALVLGLALAAPAFADAPATPQKGEALCKAAAAQLQPAPSSVRVSDKTATNLTFNITLRAKQADGSTAKLDCTVDRIAGTASIAGAPASSALTAAR
jgi:hypothetical protein